MGGANLSHYVGDPYKPIPAPLARPGRYPSADGLTGAYIQTNECATLGIGTENRLAGPRTPSIYDTI